MTIAEDLHTELTDAMRRRDKKRIDVIRQIETEVAVAKTAPGFTGAVDDDLYRSIIASFVKRMDKARLEYLAAGERGRAHAEKLEYEIDYLARWMPETLDEAATRELVEAALAELDATDPKMAGRVIGHVMKSGEPVDGSLVNRLVRERLQP